MTPHPSMPLGCFDFSRLLALFCTMRRLSTLCSLLLVTGSVLVSCSPLLVFFYRLNGCSATWALAPMRPLCTIRVTWPFRYLAILRTTPRRMLVPGCSFFHCARVDDPNSINGPILRVSSIIQTVVASVSEAEYATLFLNGKSAIPIRQVLIDMECILGHTRIITDNATAEKIANGTCNLKRSKIMDMR